MPEDDKYDALEKIGHGSFGIIRKVKRKSDGYILCRKEISYSRMSQKEREQLQSELAILKDLRHPNIVKYYERDHIKASQDLYLYMEFCGNGDLGRVIRDFKKRNVLAPEDFVWSTFSQIVSALYRCHYGEDPPPSGANVLGLGPDAQPHTGKPMILHRDLKPENIFLGEGNCVKLGDFGLSKIIQSHDFASTYVGTPFYMSPEICKAETYTLYSDIWALGCIIYEMCAREPPFNAKTHFELIQKIKSGRYPPIPKEYSQDLNKVIAHCLQVVPEHRPTTAQLLNHPAVKLMRKEQEVVQLGNNIKEKDAKLTVRENELNRREQQLIQGEQRLAAEREKMRLEVDRIVRREWEVKARLEIDRQVKQLWHAETEKLRAQFETEVNARVDRALAKYPNRLSTSPRLAPRSSTPTMPATQTDLFPADDAMQPIVNTSSTSTVGTDTTFASGTDISSLSLDDSPEEEQKRAVKRSTRRGPLGRAQTMFVAQVPGSPMDVQMADPSPAPAPPSLAGLSLSPRRHAPRQNIFAAAKDKESRRWGADVPPTPTKEEWQADDFDDDDVPVVPSPTRPRSTSNGNAKGDPPKPHAGVLPVPKPTQRLASAPSLAPNGPKSRPKEQTRPASTVPIIAASPARQRVKPFDPSSPSRKPLSAKSNSSTKSTDLPSASAGSGMKSKKGALNQKPAVSRQQDSKLQPKRNNIQGRTLVELQQARGIPINNASMSDDEVVAAKAALNGIKGPKSPSKLAASPAVWDPEVEDEMPSPFIVRSRQLAKQGVI
ncbi:kinase-like protein [Westerdykella ornata]|uniref:non-specific serine/threonine protein kinase n=1 Tax=Westerdykella ornata TaxID=318751 RepID=A0A6A6JYU7_WESOR|nr:kinase-like protein [Westerdykella ornata]KAF2281404.1 kinase-like protein [Westerdykella ornata]